MVKKWGIIGIIVAVSMTVTGCANDGKDKSVNKEYTKGITKNTLTADEVKFLTENSFYGDDQSELYDYQKDWVYRYRYAIKTLKLRYPSYDFDVFGGGDWFVSSDDNFMFGLKDEADNYDSRYFSLYMDKDGEDTGEYIVEDNFYGYLLHERYEAYIQETFSEIPLIGVYSSMSTVSSEFSEESTVDDVLESDVNPSTYLFVDIAKVDLTSVSDIVKNYVIEDGRVGDNFYIIPVESPNLLSGLSSSEMYNKCIELKYFDYEVVVNSNSYRKENSK